MNSQEYTLKKLFYIYGEKLWEKYYQQRISDDSSVQLGLKINPLDKNGVCKEVEYLLFYIRNKQILKAAESIEK